MKRIATNMDQLINAFSECKSIIKSGKHVSLSYSVSRKNKTHAQLGYVFGILISAIKNDYFNRNGENITTDECKEYLYRYFGIYDKKNIDGIDIDQKQRTMSNMSVNELSEFIQKTIDLCDEREIPILPEARYSWTRTISMDKVSVIMSKSKEFKELDSEYLNYVRGLTCLCCGRFGCVAHHMRQENTGSMGKKPPDYMAIPLYGGCHKKLHNSGNYNNIEWATNRLSWKEFCCVCYYKWLNKFN